MNLLRNNIYMCEAAPVFQENSLQTYIEEYIQEY